MESVRSASRSKATAGPLVGACALAAAGIASQSLDFALPAGRVSSPAGYGQAAQHTASPSETAVGAPTSARQAASAPAALAAMAVAGSALGTAAGSRRRRAAVAQRASRVNPDDFSDVCEQTGITLSRYLIESTKRGVIDSDLASVFNSIREASKVISKLVNTAPLRQAELLGLEGEVNVQGEDQKKLDVITNDVFKAALQYTGKLGTLASEEEDAPVIGTNASDALPVLSDTFAETGKYVCVFDPLDGSSNVDAGIPVGTIFGVFREPDADACELPDDLDQLSSEEAQCLAGALQPGKALVASGYVLYSASTELVLTIGRGVIGFTLDASIGEFVLTRPTIEIPKRGKIYSLNQANINEWDEPMQKYIQAIRSGSGESGKAYSLRYIGSMVGDIHRTLLYGGIFAYPADSKNQDGKLRLLYEGAPMSMIMEQAGGKAVTGHSRVLDIPPTKVHQRVPVILGSPEDVDECQKYYFESNDPVLKARCEARLQGLAKA